MDQVVLPQEQKDVLLDTVRNYESYRKARKRFGLDDILSYGYGMVILFYGSSGTG